MTDSTMSNEWAILCVSHQKYLFTFELLDRKNDRAHRLIFSAVGKDAVSDPSPWTQGEYYQRFNTMDPVSFESFNALALLAPQRSRSFDAAAYHVMKIGATTLITIPQIFEIAGERFGEWRLFGTTKIVYGNGKRSKPLMFAPYYPNQSPGGFKPAFTDSPY